MSNEWITLGDWRHYKLIECEVHMQSDNPAQILLVFIFSIPL